MVINKVSQKTILAIILIMLMSIIMSVTSMAWEGYPDTPINEYGWYELETHIYQVILEYNNDIIMLVSITPFYCTDDDRLHTSAKYEVRKI